MRCFDTSERYAIVGKLHGRPLSHDHQSEKLQPFTTSPEASLGANPNPDAHGDSGPLGVTPAEWCPDLRQPYIDALSSLGVGNNPDPVSAFETDKPWQALNLCFFRDLRPLGRTWATT
jgi:hypothetical protein